MKFLAIVLFFTTVYILCIYFSIKKYLLSGKEIFSHSENDESFVGIQRYLKCFIRLNDTLRV